MPESTQKPITPSYPLSIEMTRAEYDDYIKDRRVSYLDPDTGERKETIARGLKTKERLLEYVNATYGLLGHIEDIIIKDQST